MGRRTKASKLPAPSVPLAECSHMGDFGQYHTGQKKCPAKSYLPTRSENIIDHCCFKPLSFIVVYYIAIDH